MTHTLKTVALLGLLTGLLMLMGGYLGGRQGMFIALLFAGIMNFGSYYFSDKLVLSMSRAQEVGPDEAPWFHEIVDKLCMMSGQPKPKLYMINDPSPNAFATGRNPSHSAVAVTTGIVKLLNKEELEGVIAHELGHVNNRDILISTIAATLAGALMYIAFMLRWAAFFVPMGDGDDEGGGNFIGMLVLAIFVPIIATFIQMAISRSREYAADEAGARLCKKPWALANALEKLEKGVAFNPMEVNPATSHLYIVKPFSGKGLMNLMSTHPPISERIARLRQMTG